MANTTVLRSPRRFGVEHLETRLSLSVGAITPDNDVLTQSESTSLVSELDTTQQMINPIVGASTPEVGDTTIDGITKVDLTDYTSISRCRVYDNNGRMVVGYVEATNSWIEFNIYAGYGGSYKMDTAFSSASGQASVGLMVNGVVVGPVTAARTADWTSYATTSKTVTLSQGWNSIRFYSTGAGYKIGDIIITPPDVTQTVGQNTTVDLSKYSDITGGTIVGSGTSASLENVTSNSYVEYTINVQTAGTYTLSSSVSSTKSSNTINFKIDDAAAATMNFGSTGSLQSYATQSVTLNLTAGVHTLRIASNNSTYNLKNLVLKQATTPTPAPTPNTNTSTPVTVSSQKMTSYNQLNITGTSGADNITLTQSGNTLTLKANGYTTTYDASTYGNIVIKGGDGNDVITIDGSVKVITLIYGNAGNDTLTNKAADGTIVSIGDGTDTVVGAGANTSIWVDTSDSVSGYATSSLHKVSTFYGGVSLNLSGQNLADPVGGKGTTRLTNSSLWGTGPKSADVIQGQLGDCYLLASMQSMADENPTALQELAVDLGDGTYAIQFKRNGVTTFVRVDGDLAAGGPYQNGLLYAHPGASGNQWMAIIEKAYAVYRTGANSYASIATGWMSTVFSDFGIAAQSISTTSVTSFYTAVSSALNSGRTVTFGTKSSITSGTPLIGNHAYSIVGVSLSASNVLTITVRNPWGFDGAGNDGNAGDALVKISFTQLVANNIGVVLA